MNKTITRTIAIIATALTFGTAACNVEDAEQWEDVESIDATEDAVSVEDDSAGNSCRGKSHICENGDFQPGCEKSCPSNFIADCKDAGECYAATCVCWPTASEDVEEVGFD